MTLAESRAPATPGAGPSVAGAAAPAVARAARAGRCRALDALVLLLALSPLGLLVARGALRAPVWMDEVTYLVYAVDWGSRQAGSGRPVTSLEGLAYSLFSYPDLMRPYLLALRGAGLDPLASPELPLRVPSLLAAIAVAAMTFAAARRRGRALAGLAAATLSAVPLFQVHAFEGRVYALAGAAALAYALLARRLALAPRPGPALLLAVAVLGALLPWLSVWCAPLLAALPLWRGLRGRGATTAEGRTSLAVVVAVTLPGLAVALLQVVFLRTSFAYQSHLRFARVQGWRLPGRLAEALWSAPTYLEPAPPVALVAAGAAFFALAAALMVVMLVRGAARARASSPAEPLVTSMALARDDAFLPLLALAALALLAVLGAVTPGFVPGRYETPVMLLAVAAIAQLPRRAAAAALVPLLAVGLACTPWTLARIAGKGSTREMVVAVRSQGDPSRDAVLVRYRDGWDPLHRYPAWLYLCRPDRPWRCRTYPTLEPLGADFMLLRSAVDSPENRRRLAGDGAAALRAWLRRERPAAVWVLSPETEDPRRLDELLRASGYALGARRFFAGYPPSWLLRYGRPSDASPNG